MISKGDTVTVIKGKKNVGESGVVVWVGPDKYKPEAGPAARIGLKTKGGAMIYVPFYHVATSTNGTPAVDAQAALPLDTPMPVIAPAVSTVGRQRVEALELALAGMEQAIADLLDRVAILEAEKAS